MASQSELGADAANRRRSAAWRSAIDAYATGYIFECRQHRLRKGIRWLAFIGLGLPLLVGALLMAFGTGEYLKYVLIIAAPIGIVQVVLSFWALVARWDDALAYASESASANYTLSKRLKSLAENPPEDFERRLEVLEAENQQREQADYKQDIHDAEKRKGHRAALRQFQRACVGCGKVPASQAPSKCDVCGNF